MNKGILALTAALLAFSLAGCSSSSGADRSPAAMVESAPAYASDEKGLEGEAVTEDAMDPQTGGGGEGMQSPRIPQNNGRKIIWTVDMSLETLEFDKALESINGFIEAADGYAENSSQRGNSLQEGSVGDRYASIIARIPQEKLNVFLDEVEGVCNVVSIDSSAQDVSEQYTDTEMQKKSLQVEQERLLALLEKADSIETIVALETRLSEVRYRLDSLTSTLRGLDSRIDYSTVNLSLREVARESAPAPRTVSQRISSGFSDTLYDIKTGTQTLFVEFVVNLPYLILWAAIIVIILLLVRVIVRRSAKKTADAPPRQPPAPPYYGGNAYLAPEQSKQEETPKKPS